MRLEHLRPIATDLMQVIPTQLGRFNATSHIEDRFFVACLAAHANPSQCLRGHPL